jgi:4-amino-4-deoxy-L-arabinose transferase-like glycosyltransferase
MPGAIAIFRMSAGPERGPAPGQRAWFWGLMILSATLLFFDFGTRVLETNDETRFPLMARDILAHGHWLLPQINGVPMLNKPPLPAWLIAIAAWPTGAVTQRTAAVPSLIAALGVVAGTYWIGQHMFNAGVGITAGLIAVTMAGVFSLARSPVPDMTLLLTLVAAMAAFVAAELEGRPRALPVFYLLVGVAFWAKGPAGLLPLAVALVYVLTTYGWSGPSRLSSRWGLSILAIVVGLWWALVLDAGQGGFVHDVVIVDMLQNYFNEGPWQWQTLVKPFGQAVTILLPWSLLLPVALWWAVRGVETAHQRGTRLALTWAAVMFILVAISHRQRWRYYLPLCVPVALLLAAWGASLQWRWRRAVFASTCLVAATGLAVGQVVVTARATRMNDWQAISREALRTPGPMFALEAPEIVLEFYLNRPILATADSGTFVRRLGAAYLWVPERLLVRLALPEDVHVMADGRVAGRRFVLLRKE